MASRFSTGDYVAQIFAYEEDFLGLLHNLQLHVAAGHAVYAAVMLCRFSGRSSAIEKKAIIAGSGRRSNSHHDQQFDGTSESDFARQAQDGLRGNLTLTLLHVDTTWRFDGTENRLASPKLSWPAILQFFGPGTGVGEDLILRRRFDHNEAPRGPSPPAHILHVEISCASKSNKVVDEITEKLRHSLRFWTRQFLFEQDPATSKLADGTVGYVLVQEFDMRHTPESIEASLDKQWLSQLSKSRVVQTLIRICSMEGSATYHNATPQDPDELVTDNMTHAQTVGEKGPGEPYWSISPKAYVNF